MQQGFREASLFLDWGGATPYRGDEKFSTAREKFSTRPDGGRKIFNRPIESPIESHSEC